MPLLMRPFCLLSQGRFEEPVRFSVQYQFEKARFLNSRAFEEVLLNLPFIRLNIPLQKKAKLSELADVVSNQRLYKNALDIHRKHTASHLHVAACAWAYLWGGGGDRPQSKIFLLRLSIA